MIFNIEIHTLACLSSSLGPALTCAKLDCVQAFYLRPFKNYYNVVEPFDLLLFLIVQAIVK